MSSRTEELRMSFGEHLEELRRRVIFALIAPLLLAIPALVFGSRILEWLMEPLRSALRDAGLPPQVQVLTPIEPLLSYFKIAILAALLAAGPVIIWQLWRFVQPGLYPHERRFAHLLLPFSGLLVAAGVLFNYYVVLPLTLRILIAFGMGLHVPTGLTPPAEVEVPPGIVEAMPTLPHWPYDPPGMEEFQFYYNTQLNQIRLKLPDGRMMGFFGQAHSGFAQQYEIRAYLGMVLGMMLAFAIAFQLPLVVLLLGWMGLVDVEGLRRWRKYAVLGCVVTAAVLTPPDVVSQVTLAVPLYLLYELSIILLRVLPLSRMTRRTEPPDGAGG